MNAFYPEPLPICPSLQTINVKLCGRFLVFNFLDAFTNALQWVSSDDSHSL